ncbi:MAG: hypothetical protein Q8R30_00640 [bacterium]|nr:hypothetical protein [bacterium]
MSRGAWIFVVLFSIALLVMMPFIVKVEEERFREGMVRWRRIVPKSIRFGLVHVLVGVPMGVCLPLILFGLFLGWRYKRTYEKVFFMGGWFAARQESLMTVVTYHTIYNSIAIGMMLAWAIRQLVG